MKVEDDGLDDDIATLWNSIVELGKSRSYDQLIPLIEELANKYWKKDDLNFEIEGWKSLCKSLGTRSPSLVTHLHHAYSLKGDIDVEIAGWLELMIHAPSQESCLMHLIDAYKRKKDMNSEISGWKQIMMRNPSKEIEALFVKAYSRKGVGVDEEIKLWMEVGLAQPSEVAKARLEDAYNRKSDINCEIAGWRELAEGSHVYLSSLADAYRRKRDLGSEILVLEKVLKVEWSDKVAQRLADAYMYSGDSRIDLEIALRERLVKENPLSAAIHRRLVQRYTHKGGLDLAIVKLKESIRTFRTEAKVEDLMSAYKDKGDLDSEISGWEEMVNKIPDFRALQDNLGNAYERRGNIALEIDGWENLICKTDSRGWRLRRRLGDAYRRDGDIEVEIKGLNHLLDLGTVSSAYRLEDMLAGSYQRKGDIDVEIAGWEKRLARDPSNTEIHERLSKALEKRARAKQQEVELTEARIGSIPHPLDHVRLYCDTDEFDKATSILWQLLYAKPHNFAYLYTLHDVWRRINGKRVKTSLLEKSYFWWIYMLLAATRKVSVLVDWRPLANREEVFFLQVHLRKCSCVLYLISLSHS